MLLSFTEEEKRTNSERKTDILRELGTYNRRYSGLPVPVSAVLSHMLKYNRCAIRQYIHCLVQLLEHLQWARSIVLLQTVNYDCIVPGGNQ